MGNELAIRIEGLGKRYQLGQVIDLSRTFRETLIDLPRFAWQTLRQKMKMGDGPAVEANGDPDTPPGTFWALRDINLEIKHGEVLGIIGRNGAGKSTLLKIISRITTPTTGRIELFGRVGSLLEVGTGFHPELSGRENIYLNGAILGMRKAEIDKKFDEIVAFAETDKFLDTPIKKYSSGMRVRLAFAVAAHLDPEILIVDEVLAVGDAAFQKKCLGKMGEVAKQGRTVLFVSHNMNVLARLCENALWLDHGFIQEMDACRPVVQSYLTSLYASDSEDDLNHLIKKLPSDPSIRLKNVVMKQEGVTFKRVMNDCPFEIEIEYDVLQSTRGLRIFVDLCDENMDLLNRSFHDDTSDSVQVMERGTYRSLVRIPGHVLAPRRYLLQIHATIYNVRMCTGPGLTIPIDVDQTSMINRAYPQEPIRSKLLIPFSWNTIKNHS